MKQLTQSEITKADGYTYENVASPKNKSGITPIKSVGVQNGNFVYSTDDTTYTEVQGGGGAELPEIDNVKFSNIWYEADTPFYNNNPQELNMVELPDGKLVYFDDTTHLVRENGEWTTYEVDTDFDASSFYGKNIFVLFGELYITGELNNATVVYKYDNGWQQQQDVTITDGSQVWSYNGSYYYSNGTTQLVYTNGSWSNYTWGNINDFYGYNVWSDGFEYYYSDGTVNYVLDGTNWVQKTWNYNIIGKFTWTDGTSVYYSNNALQYKLVDGVWEVNTWVYGSHTANAYGTTVIQWGNKLYAQVSYTENNETTTLWITNAKQGYLASGLKTNKIGNVADNDNENLYKIGNIDNALEILNSGNIGGGGVLITKTITENGTYNAIDDGASGYSQVVVNVAGGGGSGMSADEFISTDFTTYTGEATSVKNRAFAQNETVEDVTLDDAVNVGDFAFSECESLQSVSLASATQLGTGVFSNCPVLTSVYIPNITEIPDECFSSSGMTSFDFTGITSIGSGAFIGTPIYPSTNTGDILTIGVGAFLGNEYITSLSLANATDVSGFSDCMNLISVNLPSATRIGYRAFANCPQLATINIPVVEYIGANAFENNEYITAVSYSTLLEVMEGAFAMCGNLTTVNLQNATSVQGFDDCNSLTSVTLPSATDVGGFRNCGSLTSISLPSATTIIDGAFQGCMSLTTVSIPLATYIGGWAFADTGITSITLTNVTSVGERTFSNTGITSLSCPALEVASPESFAGMSSLTDIIFGLSLTEVYEGVFNEDDALTTVTFNGTTPPSFNGDPFAAASALTTINIPTGTLTNYTTALNDAGLSQYVSMLTQI